MVDLWQALGMQRVKDGGWAAPGVMVPGGLEISWKSHGNLLETGLGVCGMADFFEQMLVVSLCDIRKPE